MRKTSLRNKTNHQQSKLLVLTSRVHYSKPLTNSFRSNLVISSTMNVQDNDELESAQITTSNEVKAADAAMETELVENSEADTSEVESLIDYNEVEESPAELAAKAKQKKADRKALKETLANQGFAMRNILRENRVKAHFTSPFSTENQMSPEDIFSELPKEDLHEVGVVQRRIFMPASFVQKWIIPTIRARNATAINCQEVLKRQCCFRFSTNRSWTQPSHVNNLTRMLTQSAQ